jgi:hypothetical protein
VGKVVSFEVGEDLLANDPPANEMPLLGIEYDKHGPSYLHGKRGGNTNYTVDEPDLVWATQDEHGGLVAVEMVAILHLEP